MTRLVLSFLGGYEVRLNGEVVTGFRSDKARALLAYLAVEPERAHLRPRLAGLLWPDYEETYALTYLRHALANVRHVLAEEIAPVPALLVTGGALQFNVRSDSRVDVIALRDALRRAEGGLDDAGAAQLAEGMTLYHGPLLEGFHLDDSSLFEEWLTLSRERLHIQALDALSRLAEYRAAQGRIEQALAHARRLVELEPEREESRRLLMRLLAESGHRSEALAEYESLRAILRREQQGEPDAETAALVEQIRRGDLGTARASAIAAKVVSAAPRHNLPAQPTALVGRSVELEEIAGLLANPACRLLTLVGMGGIGKTRLALAAAAQRVDGFRDGVWLVSLASLSSPFLLATAILEALEVARHGGALPEELLLRYVRDKQMLLVLDNFEHLMEGTALLTRVLEAGAGLKLLVTSRERLQLKAEWVYQVEGMALPQESGIKKGRDFKISASDDPESSVSLDAEWPDALATYDGIRLFVQSAQRVDPAFRLTADNGTAVWRICRQVEGMPLGIELAAGWTRMLSCEAIAHQLSGGLDVLRARTRDAPARQQSLQAVFEHSWRMLTTAERASLAQLGVFRGGFDLAAAQTVAGAGLEVLSDLVDKSWLRVIDGRYEMHELVRQYALEKLAVEDEGMPADPSRQVAARRHSAYYSGLLRRLSADLWKWTQFRAAATLLTETGNVQAGWRWAVRNHAAELIDGYLDALGWMIWYRGWYPEIERALTNAAASLRAALLDPAVGEADRQGIRRTLLRVLLVRVRDELAYNIPPGRTASNWAEFLDFWRGAGAGLLTDPEEMLARVVFAQWLRDRAETPDLAEAIRIGEEALAFFLSRDHVLGTFFASLLIGVAQNRRGRYPEARQSLIQGLAGLERGAERLPVGIVQLILGDSLRLSGDLVGARRLYDGVVASRRETAYPIHLYHALSRSGECSLACGEHDRARREFAESLELADELGQSNMAMWPRRGLAEVLYTEGDYEGAKRLLAGVLESARSLGAYPDRDDVRVTLSRVESALGNYAEAAALLAEALAVSERLQTVNKRTKALATIAVLLHEVGRLEPAAQIAAFLEAAPEADYLAKVGAREVLSALGPDSDLAPGGDLTLDACVAMARRELARLAL